MQILWQPPGSTGEVIRESRHGDLYVDEDSLFALLHDTGEWFFHNGADDGQVRFDRRS